MTTNEKPKTIVTEATVLGQNCGACGQFKMGLVMIDQIGATCCINRPIIWNNDGTPHKNTEHPPGRSVCPQWEDGDSDG